MKGGARPVNFSKCRETPMQTGAAYARRQVLRVIASAAAVCAAWAKAFAIDKLAKSDVDYRDRPKGKERCDNCRVWVPPDSCKSVEGPISPSGWCNIWRPAVVQNAIVPDPEERLTKDDVAYKNTRKAGSAATIATCSCPRTAAPRFRVKSARAAGAIFGDKRRWTVDSFARRRCLKAWSVLRDILGQGSAHLDERFSS